VALTSSASSELSASPMTVTMLVMMGSPLSSETSPRTSHTTVPCASMIESR
jgi:hypothetical protein